MFHALHYYLRARTPLTVAIGDWLTHIQNLSISTQKMYIQILLDFVNGHKFVESVKPKDIRLYISKLLWNHKKSTSNKYLIALKSFFRFCSEEYDIPNPALGIKKIKNIEQPYQPFINKTQYEKILLSATQRESDVIKLLANLGLRASELCSLRPENISPTLSSIRIQGKGGKTRTIPCNQTVREILSRSINLPKNRKSIYKICRKAGNKCGISLAPHMLRRYFATQLYLNKISLLKISLLLGHGSIRTTEIYLRWDGDLSGSTDCLD